MPRRHRGCPGNSSYSPRVGLGVRCTAAPIGSAQAQPDATPLLPPDRSAVLGFPVVVVAGLARSPDYHSTRNSPALASSRNICDLEVSITWALARRAPQDRRRDPPSDRRHGSRDFSLGCTAHSRRAVEAWHHRLAELQCRAICRWRMEAVDHRDGGHSYGTMPPRLSAAGVSKGTVGLTTSVA
jgi:hypothetical protein